MGVHQEPKNNDDETRNIHSGSHALNIS